MLILFYSRDTYIIDTIYTLYANYKHDVIKKQPFNIV